MAQKNYVEDTISIVCPARNAQESLGQAIESVLSQTYGNWELLIIDDLSSDETESIARKYAAADSRISVRLNKGVGGAPRARNVGLRAARGRWVAFLDSDDAWLPDKLSKTLAFALEKQSPLSFTAYRAFSADGARVGRLMSVPERVDYRHLLTKNVIATSSVLLDRALTGPIEMRNVSSSDFVCWLEILRQHKFACGLSEDLLRYRLTPGSLSRNKIKVPSKIWKIYREREHFGVFKSSFLLLIYALRSGRKYFQMTRATSLREFLSS